MKVEEKIEQAKKILNEIDRDFRNKLIDLTPAEASRITGVTKATLYQYVKNERNLTYDKLLEYAEKLFKKT